MRRILYRKSGSKSTPTFEEMAESNPLNHLERDSVTGAAATAIKLA
jgi:hypothetical protein